MKKIGILHGMERSFPEAFVERINKMGLKDIQGRACTGRHGATGRP